MTPDPTRHPLPDNAPIFIGGPDRCGKTTLQAFLSSHPRITIPAVGSNLWSYFYGQFGDLRSPENFEHCLAALMRYKHAVFLKPDGERIRNEFWQGEPSYARLFALLHQQYAERAGKPRWGDQTGLIERYADQVLAAYPEAKMLHMIRDPRDRYAASLEMWPEGKGRVGAAVGRWLYSTRLAQRNLARYPDRYMVIRFESLVRNPESTLRSVCSFIHEEFSEEMLAMGGSPGHRSKLVQGFEEETASAAPLVPLSPGFIGRYRQQIKQADIAFIQAHASREMAAFDYKLDKVHFSPAEHFKYRIITHQVELVRMGFWLAREHLQQRFPKYLRRRPSKWMEIPQRIGQPYQEGRS